MIFKKEAVINSLKYCIVNETKKGLGVKRLVYDYHFLSINGINKQICIHGCFLTVDNDAYQWVVIDLDNFK